MIMIFSLDVGIHVVNLLEHFHHIRGDNKSLVSDVTFWARHFHDLGSDQFQSSFEGTIVGSDALGFVSL